MGGAKKEFLTIDGNPVLARAIAAFADIPEITRLVVTMVPDQIERTRQMLLASFEHSDASHAKPELRVVPGGESRQESVRCGLEALGDRPPAYVMIHDGARPWITSKLLRQIISITERMGSCIPVITSPDALKRIDSEGRCIEHIDKSEVVCVQTPQAFRFSEILEAHRNVADINIDFADDAQVLQYLGGEVHTVPGDPMNRKITYLHDLSMNGC